MTTRTAKTSPLIIARLAGFLYLLTVPLGVFNFAYLPSSLIVSGDAAATAHNIMASESLFRLGIVSALLGAIIAILYVLMLYKLLKPVSKDIAVLMVVLALMGIPIAMLNELTQLGVLQLLSGADYLTVFTTAQLQALAYLFVRLHSYGISIAFIFSGLWLLPLGYLVFKSGFLPKILGVLLIIGGFGYLIDVFAEFLFPGSNLSIGLFTGLSEIFFLLWLLIKGVNVEQWKVAESKHI
ncbi:MAG: DUF4386 domain-containing protein [Anaerolineales bacterium]|nr:DUF4386 domain-containing protein [Anaerolineales bacterium]